MSHRLQRLNERRDTVCDREKRTENAEAHAGTTGTTIPDCCGPMVERMFKAFGGTGEGAVNGESAWDKSTGLRSCASIMEEMASSCCGPSPQKTTSDE